MVNEACVSKTRVAYVRPRDWLNNKVKAAITIPCIALKHRPLIPIITVWLPAINTRYRCLLANAPNNLQPNYNALSTRQFRFQCSRATFSDQMPVSLPNKRVPVTPPPLPPPLHPYEPTGNPLSTPITPLSSLIRVKITNWFRSSLCMNQASRVRDAPLARPPSPPFPLADGRARGARAYTYTKSKPARVRRGTGLVPTTPFHTHMYSFDSKFTPSGCFFGVASKFRCNSLDTGIGDSCSRVWRSSRIGLDLS